MIPVASGIAARRLAACAIGMALAFGFGACVPVPARVGPSAPTDATRGGSTATEPSTRSAAGSGGQRSPLVPAGHGTLRQEEITVVLRSGTVQVKVTPLAEPVIRLTAPDTYGRLHALAESYRADLGRSLAGAEPALFLVSFFSPAPAVGFQPEDLQITQQGQLHRPIAIRPITPGWGRQRLDPQEPQMAVYSFADGINLELPLTVRYGMATSNAWARLLPSLELERTRVRARSGGKSVIR